MVDYSKIKVIKDRIEGIKSEILNGVKIRSKVEEQLQGEQVSAYIIKKQASISSKHLIKSIKSERGILENIDENMELNNRDLIQLYISEYYKKLYKGDEYDTKTQEWFLRFIDRKLNEDDCNLLEKKLSELEVYNAISKINRKKSPGIDGLPIEFYAKFWKVIKNELVEVITNIAKGMLLEEKQRKAILTLIHKDGEMDKLKNWRPISLICTDVKIVAKILALRLGSVMDKVISKNQFCVPGRSIIECNNNIRDTVFYFDQKT